MKYYQVEKSTMRIIDIIDTGNGDIIAVNEDYFLLGFPAIETIVKNSNYKTHKELLEANGYTWGIEDNETNP